MIHTMATSAEADLMTDEALLVSTTEASSGPRTGRIVARVRPPEGGESDRLTDREEPPSSLPPWIDDFLEQLLSLLELPEDWDSYGGGPPPVEAVEAAALFVLDAVASDSRSHVGAPRVYPESSGEVGLSWATADAELDISIRREGEGSFYLEDFAGRGDLEGEVTDHPRLDEAFARL